LTFKHSEDTTNTTYQHPPDFVSPVMFSFKPNTYFGKKKVFIKVNDSDWSNKFSLDVAGSSGSISCKSNNNIFHVKMFKYGYVLISSNLESAIDWREHSSFKLKSHQAGNFHSVLHDGEPHFVHHPMPRRRSALDGH